MKTEIFEQFRRIVGPKGFLHAQDELLAFVEEPRGLYHGKAAFLLRPSSTEQVSKILALAHETRTPIVPQGGNTGLVGGQTPDETGEQIILSLSGLNRIRSIDPEGNTLTTEAGVTLARVHEEALRVNRFFPLSIAAEGSCQIGGNLATNAGGLAVLAYGNTRDLVLGIEVVLADGRVWSGLRALRKDNTGYDLKQLFIGSEGTLGIITAAVLKLFPVPTEKITAFIGLRDLDSVHGFFTRALDSAGPTLTAFELMPRIGVEFVVQHIPGTRDPLKDRYPWYVLLELSGHTADDHIIAKAENFLAESLDGQLISDAVVASSIDQSRSLWALRENLSDVQKFEGGSIKHDVSVPIARITEFIHRANRTVERLIPGIRPVPFGHFGDGNIHYNVTQPVGMQPDDFIARWDEVTDAVHKIVIELDGSVSAEHGIGRMKRDLLPHIKTEVEIDLMRSIKNLLDPRGILNPGKLL